MNDNIAIIMATYNGEKYIKEQIDSILEQTYTNWTLYINDDSSNDKTIKILKEYREQYSTKIVLMKNESNRHGATANFADLFGKVTDADYFVFCDQDDRWENCKLELMLRKIKEEETKKLEPLLVYCRMNIVNQDMQILATSLEDYTHVDLGKTDHFLKLLMVNYVPGCAMFFNRELKEKISCFPETIGLHDWWVILICATMGRVERLENPALANYRQHVNNTLGVKNTKSTILRILDNLNYRTFKKHADTIIEGRTEAVNQIEHLLKIYGIEMQNEKKELAEKMLTLLKSRNRIKSVVLGLKYPYLGNTIYERIIFWWFVPHKCRKQ